MNGKKCIICYINNDTNNFCMIMKNIRNITASFYAIEVKLVKIQFPYKILNGKSKCGPYI